VGLGKNEIKLFSSHNKYNKQIKIFLKLILIKNNTEFGRIRNIYVPKIFIHIITNIHLSV
jgi:hypothetical protein